MAIPLVLKQLIDRFTHQDNRVAELEAKVKELEAKLNKKPGRPKKDNNA